MNWNDIENRICYDTIPPKRVEKTNEEWKRLLSPEQYIVTRLHDTEIAFSGNYCEIYSPGVYACACCDTLLFDSTGKFDSGTGWPSFTGPITNNVLQYREDNSYGLSSVEVNCNVCDAHLGHVFPDGPNPSRLRFCINSISLIKKEPESIDIATLGGGCFWCTEALMNELEGVTRVQSGYAGGDVYAGDAEVVQVCFDPRRITYADLLRIFLATHDPTTPNRQGADIGTQYRSIILYHHEEQLQTARAIIEEMKADFNQPIVTEVAPFSRFTEAQESDRQYYVTHPEQAYCQLVITPKLQKMRAHLTKVLAKKA